MTDYTADYSFLGMDGLKGGTLVKVVNYARANVGIIMKDGNILEFQPFVSDKQKDVKQVPFGTLYDLKLSPGGEKMLTESLYIADNNIRKVLMLEEITDETPEKSYTFEELSTLLSEDREDLILDALEFGPTYLGGWLKRAILEQTNINIIEKYSKILKLNPANFKKNYDGMNSLSTKSSSEGSEGFSTIETEKPESAEEKKTTINASSGKRRARK